MSVGACMCVHVQVNVCVQMNGCVSVYVHECMFVYDLKSLVAE